MSRYTRAQVLFAFLLGIASTHRFESVTALQRNVYFATLLLTAAAMARGSRPRARAGGGRTE